MCEGGEAGRKSSRELEEKGKNDILTVGQRTGAYVAISTLSSDFTGSDKRYFEELVERGVKPILLTRRHLEMSYIDVSNYRRQVRGFRRDVDTLARLTASEILGEAFAVKHGLGV